MNSREFGHERFEELSALSAIGQISAEEFRELQAHLQSCATCRLRQADFTEILHEHLPLLAPTDATMPGSRNVAFHDASYKQRFIQRAQKEGIVFSPEVTGAKNLRPLEASRWRDLAWLWQPKRLAFSLALVALGFWLGSLGASRALKVNVPPSPELANVREENSRLRQQIEQFATQPPKAPPEALVSQPRPMAPAANNADLERQLAQARRDSAAALARTQVLDEELQKTSGELASLREEASKLRSDSGSAAKLKETEAALQAASSELQKLQRERSVYASTFADQQTQIRDLMEKLGTQTEGIEQERRVNGCQPRHPTADGRPEPAYYRRRRRGRFRVRRNNRWAVCFTLRESLSSFTHSIWRSDGSRWRNTRFKPGAKGKPKAVRCRAWVFSSTKTREKAPGC